MEKYLFNINLSFVLFPLAEHCGPDLRARFEIEMASIQASTIDEAQSHCQTLDMELFSPVNRGQIAKMLEIGFEGKF